MGEDGRAIAPDVLVEPDAGAGLGHDRCERGLADLKRITPQVVAVQFDEAEGIKKYALASAVVTDEIERGNAVVIATASPSMMQERERRRANVSTISGKRRVKSLRGRLESLTSAPVLRAMMRNPSCLIWCSHWLPEGSLSVLVGRHGAMNPAGRVRCNMWNR